ncbi:DUF4435 domain-containing protein [Methanogenium organophilum]|uniref:DUF4435 domain-containing protein n=1 Tax=Methanogenium organophilum TaxID=2199 RepID=A0A9X9T6D1_METOG|nr:DUF4435 domain-containing protein [Methanogenium organophilum]WAI00278.1 DUF4435 domain-containing protein [Methanogenium organophilum]
MKGKNRRFAGYRLEDIWADPEEIRGSIETMEMTYPGMGGKVFVITEGPYDLEVYDRCFNSDACILRIANSKENVCEVVKGVCMGDTQPVADETGDDGGGGERRIIGIIDSDYSLFDRSSEVRENIFRTDTHDLETMLVASGALENVIEHIETVALPQTFAQKAYGSLRQGDLRAALTRAARYLGLAVFVNNEAGLNITFKHINCKKRDTFSRFVNAETLECDIEAMKQVILEKNADRGEEFIDIFEGLVRNSGGYYFEYPWHICRGHDLICVLLRDINMRYSLRDGEQIKGRDLERLLRRHYQAVYFADTDLCRQIRHWEEEIFGNEVSRIFSPQIYRALL